jgi:hypothetical protein
MMLPEFDQRRQKSRPMTRVGSGSGETVIDDVFSSGGPVLIEARFRREEASPDFYLMHQAAEFRELAAQYRGDSPELHLSRADSVPNTAQLIAYWANGNPEQMRSGLERLVGKLLLVRCSHAGESDYYTLLASQEDIEEFLAYDWAGWRVAAYDAWEASRHMHSVTLYPQVG